MEVIVKLKNLISIKLKFAVLAILIISLGFNIYFLYNHLQIKEKIKSTNETQIENIMYYKEEYFSSLKDLLNEEANTKKTKELEDIRSKYINLRESVNAMVLMDSDFFIYPGYDKNLQLCKTINKLFCTIEIMQSTPPFFLADLGGVKSLESEEKKFLLNFSKEMIDITGSINMPDENFSSKNKERVISRMKELNDSYWKWKDESF